MDLLKETQARVDMENNECGMTSVVNADINALGVLSYKHLCSKVAD